MRQFEVRALYMYVTQHGLNWSHGIQKSDCCVHGGHLRSHFRSRWGQMSSNWSKTLKGRILKSLPFIWDVILCGLIFFIFFFRSPGGGRVQVNQAIKHPDFIELSKKNDKTMPNGEKNSQKSKQTFFS